MIEVELPDGSIAEFPDNTPDQEIERVLGQEFGSQAGAPAQDQMEPEIGLMDRLRNAYQGYTANFGDEIVAAGAATAHPLKYGDDGTDWGQRYDTYLARERRKIDDYRRARPVEATAVEVAGAIPGMLLPTRWLGGLGRTAQADSLAKRAKAGGTVAAIYGGAYGYGAGEGGAENRAKSAALTGAFAVPLGAAAPVIGDKMARAVGKLSRQLAATKMAKEAPTTGQLMDRKSAAYTAAEALDAPPPKAEMLDFMVDLKTDLWRAGYRPNLSGLKEVKNVMAELDKVAGTLDDPTTLAIMRRISQDAAGSSKGNAARLGRLIRKKIDNLAETLDPRFAGQLKEANRLNQRYHKSKDMDKAIDNATRQASGYENGLRIAATQMLKNEKIRRGLTPDEVAMLNDLSQGGPISNTLRKLGYFGLGGGKQHNVLSALVATGGAGMAGGYLGDVGPEAALATLLLGTLSRRGAAAMTDRRAKLAQALMARGGKLPVRNALPNGRLSQLLLQRAAPAQLPSVPVFQE
tara:strand:+ start:4274 stop:5833 length:1560 start_codon:yes stop_codon:yes gene_type:complete